MYLGLIHWVEGIILQKEERRTYFGAKENFKWRGELILVERRASGEKEDLRLKISSPQFPSKNSGFCDQIFGGEL